MYYNLASLLFLKKSLAHSITINRLNHINRLTHFSITFKIYNGCFKVYINISKININLVYCKLYCFLKKITLFLQITNCPSLWKSKLDSKIAFSLYSDVTIMTRFFTILYFLSPCSQVKILIWNILICFNILWISLKFYFSWPISFFLIRSTEFTCTN